MTTFKLS